jgi:hypothetical protein
LEGASQFGRAAVQLAVPERGSMSTKTASSPAAPKSNRKGPKSTRGESPKRSQKSARKKGKTPRAKPTGAKGTYLKKVAVSSTMGPGVKVDVASLSAGA